MRSYKWRLEVGKMFMYLAIPVFCFLVYKSDYMQNIYLSNDDKTKINPELYTEQSPWKALKEMKYPDSKTAS